ncbi:hypothetical protein RA273_28500, partial [Pseudomonas syringae pv. tagetis]
MDIRYYGTPNDIYMAELCLDQIDKRGRPQKKGEFMIRQGVTFQSDYTVRSRPLKTVHISPPGEE